MAIEAPDPDSLAALQAGDVVVEETRLDESGGTVRVRILVQTTAVEVWQVIGSCAHARRYLAGMEACEVLVDEPARAVTHHVVDPGFFAPTLDYRFNTIRRPHTRMDFRLTEGTLRQMEGYWLLVPLDDGLLVEHELRVRPNAPAPRWLVRRKLKNDLPRMMTCIRALAGGSPTPELERSDLETCEPPPEDQAQ